MEERCSGESTDLRAERAAKAVLDAAFRVHSELGPGLLESVYESCLAWELESVAVPFERQLVLPVRYRNLDLDAGLRLDLLIDDCLIVEVKAVDSLSEVHRAQLLTYLKLARKRLGLLLNFNVTHLRQGIRRVVL
ncbi:MAG: GxxExxY protein [Lysobacterales bacterium]